MSKKILYIPLYFIFLYVLVTYILSIIGPYTYSNYNPWIVFIFLAFFLLIISLFYFFGIKDSSKLKRILLKRHKFTNSKSILTFTEISVTISFLIFSGLFFTNIASHGLPSISSILSSLGSIMSASYDQSVHEYTFNIFAWIYSYLGFICNISVILGLYYFKKEHFFIKLIYIFGIVCFILYTILFVGSLKYLGDIIIYTVSVIIIKYYQNKADINTQKSRKYNVLRFFLALSILFIFIYFMAFALGSRSLYYNSAYWNNDYFVYDFYQLDLNNWMLLPFSQGTKIGLSKVILYFSMGYYGLYQCISLPFEWTAGLGNSPAFTYIIEKIFSINANSIGLSYIERLQLSGGWDGFANWNTIFPWLASDFSFIGAVFVLGILFMFYAKAWKYAIKNKNWASILFVAHINILIAFIPANNQIVQTRPSLLTTIFIFIVWFIFKNDNTRENEICKKRYL